MNPESFVPSGEDDITPQPAEVIASYAIRQCADAAETNVNTMNIGLCSEVEAALQDELRRDHIESIAAQVIARSSLDPSSRICDDPIYTVLVNDTELTDKIVAEMIYRRYRSERASLAG